MGFGDMAYQTRAVALPRAGSAGDVPLAVCLAIAMSVVEDLSMGAHEMVRQPHVISVEDDRMGARVDLARHRRGVKEEGRKSRVIDEEVTVEGVAQIIARDGSGTAADAAHDRGRGGGD
jgi:hypothetical protein